MRRWLLPVALLLLSLPPFLLGCKSQGEVDVALDFPAECTEATHAQVYFIRGGLCSACSCGNCLRNCTADNCTLGCTDGLCTIDELDNGLTATPPAAGNYAVIYQLVRAEDGRMQEVASACVDGIQFDKDGTSNSSFSAAGTCCPAQPSAADAGVLPVDAAP